jgi:predicted metal-dependent enzyme (double-stranded beta helix superfamily)
MTTCSAKTFVATELPGAVRQLLQDIVSSLSDKRRLLALSTKFEPTGNYPHAPHCYSRNILLRQDNGSEVMVARWDQGASTPIHGHPQYAFVYILQGQLQLEHYRETDQGLLLTDTIIKRKGQHIYAAGTPNRFDNAIHRVTALTPSLSLHVYSDDASKGKAFL